MVQWPPREGTREVTTPRHHHHLSLTPPASPTPTPHTAGEGAGGTCGPPTHTPSPGPSSPYVLGVGVGLADPPTPPTPRFTPSPHPHAPNGTPSSSPSTNGVNGVGGRLAAMEVREEEEEVEEEVVELEEDYEDESEDESDLRCGLGRWCSPRWAQVFAVKQVFLVVFSLTSVLQGMFYTYYVSVLTTVERLFQFKSKTTGIIMSATEMGQIGGALLLAYYGGQGHRPKWIGWGMLLFAFCSFLSALPHFLYGTELIRKHLESTPTQDGLFASSNLCRPQKGEGDVNPFTSPLSDVASDPFSYNVTMHPDSLVLDPTAAALDCESPEAEAQVVLSIFFLSLLGIGIGQTAAYNLGIPYIDDNIANQETPIYFAVTSGVRILGPTFGFVLGFVCTRLYVDPLADPGIEPTDPRWIGAWWLGLVVVAATLSLTSIAMFAFPRHLPRPRRRRHPPPPSHHLDPYQAVAPCPRPNTLAIPPRPRSRPMPRRNTSLTDFARAVWRLLRNRILLLRTASNVLHILPIAGLYTFLPKYLESQFRLPVHSAALVSGIGGILVMGVGIFASGLYIWQAKPSPRTVAAWIALSALVYAIGMVILMFVGCPPEDFVGLVEDEDGKHFEPMCDLDCGECDLTTFAPVCDPARHKAYFSPCHAGCSNASRRADTKELVFSHCNCLEEGDTVVMKTCGAECNNFEWYVVIFSAFVLVHSTSEVGGMLLTLRCVAPKDKAMALGLISVAIGLLSNVPCPIIYGAVVDAACIQWKETCSRPGACQLYDTDAFRMFFHGMTGAVMLLAFFVDISVWYLADTITFDDNASSSPISSPIKSPATPEPPVALPVTHTPSSPTSAPFPSTSQESTPMLLRPQVESSFIHSDGGGGGGGDGDRQ
ncbi:solute carrier organic anion transporter family member 74D-like [Eriocheir sinensis]|uniref:solute carrier organic anion transporter family member 74D-like n=1 Tax=Eriocheir sinensis TaxID=95602 RepID=UPI0021C6B100|nr:solute carrier organic anion transporter family member 74D-like [Eriocheir sinensis]